MVDLERRRLEPLARVRRRLAQPEVAAQVDDAVPVELGQRRPPRVVDVVGQVDRVGRRRGRGELLRLGRRLGPDRADDPVGIDPGDVPVLARAESGMPQLRPTGVGRGDRIGLVEPRPVAAGRQDDPPGELDGGLVVARGQRHGSEQGGVDGEPTHLLELTPEAATNELERAEVVHGDAGAPPGAGDGADTRERALDGDVGAEVADSNGFGGRVDGRPARDDELRRGARLDQGVEQPGPQAARLGPPRQGVRGELEVQVLDRREDPLAGPLDRQRVVRDDEGQSRPSGQAGDDGRVVGGLVRVGRRGRFGRVGIRVGRDRGEVGDLTKVLRRQGHDEERLAGTITLEPGRRVD